MKVEVFLAGATGVKNTDCYGRAESYAIVKVSDQTRTSKTSEGRPGKGRFLCFCRPGDAPVWNQQFVFDIDDGEEVEDVFVKVYDKDAAGGDDFVGTVRVPLKGAEQLKSYDVVLPSGKKHGNVKLSVKAV